MNLEARERLIQIIKKARGKTSQRAFGKLLGVSATAVQLWEKGETVPDTENLIQIAERAGYSLQELLAYLEGKPLGEPVNQLDVTLRWLETASSSELAVLLHAVGDRLSAVLEGHQSNGLRGAYPLPSSVEVRSEEFRPSSVDQFDHSRAKNNRGSTRNKAGPKLDIANKKG